MVNLNAISWIVDDDRTDHLSESVLGAAVTLIYIKARAQLHGNIFSICRSLITRALFIRAEINMTTEGNWRFMSDSLFFHLLKSANQLRSGSI